MAAVDDSMVRRSPTISDLITKLKLLKPQGVGREIYSLIVKNFGNVESTLIGASLKKNRDSAVSAVCSPQFFKGSNFMERETQMALLDNLLFNPKNAKEKRNLIVAVAASGMGKSAFVDEYSSRLLNKAKDHQLSNIHPIAITFNTDEFGGSIEGSTSVDLAARLLMSYYVSNPSKDLLQNIFDILFDNSKFIRVGGTNAGVLKATIESIKDDLRMRSGATKSKILIACDEVGKSRDEKQVVQLLCALIDGDDDLECFFTGLTLNPFSKESSSGRFMKFVPLPLLTFAASLSLVHSFLKEPHPFVVSSKLARLSGGHPRTIQIIDSISASPAMRAMSWTDDKKFEAVVESTILSLPNRLTEAQIMLLLRPQTLLSDVKTNTELIEALEKGSLYATVLDNSYVELFTSPMLLRSSLRKLIEEGNRNVLLANLNEMLTLAGLRNWKEFRTFNWQRNGKIFETFFLCMEMLRRGFQESQLDKREIKIADLYPSVTYQQNCKSIRYKLVDSYNVMNVTCKSDFPSIDPVDASVVKKVKALVDNTDSNDVIVRPAKENQAAYDFLFILKEFPTNMPFIQLMEPTISAGGPDPKDYFSRRYVEKLQNAESLAWNELGIDVKKIVHTFISMGDTSDIDWATTFEDAGYWDRRILILDRADVRAFYGPMMNLLFSICFDD